MKLLRRTWILIAAALLWGLFIFGNSLLPGDASTQLSDNVVENLPGGWFSWLDVHALTVLVRKSAHFLEYALLGALTSAAFASEARLAWKNAGNILLPCLLWAVADEFLQTFIKGRTGLVRDVVIDFCGILAGCLLAAILFWLWRRRRQRRGCV